MFPYNEKGQLHKDQAYMTWNQGYEGDEVLTCFVDPLTNDIWVYGEIQPQPHHPQDTASH